MGGIVGRARPSIYGRSLATSIQIGSPPPTFDGSRLPKFTLHQTIAGKQEAPWGFPDPEDTFKSRRSGPSSFVANHADTTYNVTTEQ